MIGAALDWHEQAVCVGMDPRLFEYDPEGYPTKMWGEWQADIESAIDTCMGCPVLLECKKSASGPDRDNTVRGGLRPRNYTRAERDLNVD